MKTRIGFKTLIVVLLIIFIILLFFVPKEYLKPIITGKVITKVLIISRLGFNCSAYLFEGWNLVSMPCIGEGNSINFSLATINENYISIHTYEIENKTDPWKSYNPSLPSWVVQDISNISEKKGYWINMINDDFWLVNGSIVWPAITEMYTGWNLVGFHSNTTMRINESLQTIDGSYTAVYEYDANHSQWLIYYPYLPEWVEQNLTNMTLYYGYWINMTQNDTWILGS